MEAKGFRISAPVNWGFFEGSGVAYLARHLIEDQTERSSDLHSWKFHPFAGLINWQWPWNFISVAIKWIVWYAKTCIDDVTEHLDLGHFSNAHRVPADGVTRTSMNNLEYARLKKQSAEELRTFFLGYFVAYPLGLLKLPESRCRD